MMEAVLPWFNLGNAAVSLGLASSATAAAVAHVGRTRLEHLGESLADLPTIRAQIARMAIALSAQKAYLNVAANSVSSPDASPGSQRARCASPSRSRRCACAAVPRFPSICP